MTSPPLITANITKNASNVPISLQFYKMFPIQQVFMLKNEKGAVETTAPPGDSGGIQTHDLQNRNLTLYSAKLRNHCDFAVANLRKLFQTDERLLHKKRAKQTFS